MLPETIEVPPEVRQSAPNAGNGARAAIADAVTPLCITARFSVISLRTRPNNPSKKSRMKQGVEGGRRRKSKTQIGIAYLFINTTQRRKPREGHERVIIIIIIIIFLSLALYTPLCRRLSICLPFVVGARSLSLVDHPDIPRFSASAKARHGRRAHKQCAKGSHILTKSAPSCIAQGTLKPDCSRKLSTNPASRACLATNALNCPCSASVRTRTTERRFKV